MSLNADCVQLVSTAKLKILLSQQGYAPLDTTVFSVQIPPLQCHQQRVDLVFKEHFVRQDFLGLLHALKELTGIVLTYHLKVTAQFVLLVNIAHDLGYKLQMVNVWKDFTAPTDQKRQILSKR